MKKILLGLIVVLIMIGAGYWWTNQEKGTRPIETHTGDLTKEDAIEDLNEFLDDHDEEFVILSLTLDGKMAKQLADGILHSPIVPFQAQDPDDSTKTIQYILRLREDGVREFVFDEESGKFEGVFRIFKQTTPNGEYHINLIVISPSEYKKSL